MKTLSLTFKVSRRDDFYARALLRCSSGTSDVGVGHGQ